MLNSTITWGGRSSDEFNLKIERFPDIIKSARKYEKVSVPGRNGDLYFFDGSFENYIQPYSVYAGSRTDKAAYTSWNEIMEWLVPEPAAPTIDDYINLTLYGYKRLIDSNEPDVIRLALFASGLSAENSWNRFGRATIEFDCRPERFTTDAFTPIPIANSGSYIMNPTDRPAKPCIKVYGTEGGSVVINGYVLTLSSINAYTYIDCESQNAFKSLAENMNNTVVLTSGFPVLTEGNNDITWTGGITSLEIVPRWWRL